MRIDSLKIENFRQYQNVVYEFPQVPGKSDIHIILGNNGVGKTNMLNAITWCLYGKENHLGDKNTASKMINNQTVVDLRAKGEKIGLVIVTIAISSEDDSIQEIRVKRVATFNISDNSALKRAEELTVSYNQSGEWKITTSEEEANSLIHRYVPEEINEYIFFDGEQLEKYFQERQRENISQGIQELTQSTVLEKTATAFNNYIVNELSPRLRNSDDSEVQRCQEDVDVAKSTCETAVNTIAEFNRQIDKFNQEISEIDIRLKGHENIREKRDRYMELESLSDSLQTRLRNKIAELMKFTREYYVYFATYPAVKSLYDYIKQQEKEGKLPPKIDKKLLETILSNGKCQICGNTLDEEHRQFAQKLLNVLSVSSATSAELNRAIAAIEAFISDMKKYPDMKAKFIAEYQDIKKDIKANEAEYIQLSELLKSIPNNEALARDVSNREALRSQLKRTTENLGAEKKALEQAEARLSDAEAHLQVALERNKKFAQIKQDIEYCKKCKVKLDEIRDELLTECRSSMQKATFEIFSKLLWKKDAFAEIQIRDDYAFQLLNSFGEQTLGSCSAAERVLLALSFTLALQEISKHDSLLYIDTPIGRVDVQNRGNFMRVLLDIASGKQVILTFTPAEYDFNVRRLLEGKYSTFSELKMVNNVTTIKDDGK